MNDECLTYSIPHAGKLLGYSRNTAYDAAKRGELPTIRLGRKIRVPKAALQRLLDGAASASRQPGWGNGHERVLTRSRGSTGRNWPGRPAGSRRDAAERSAPPSRSPDDARRQLRKENRRQSGYWKPAAGATLSGPVACIAIRVIKHV